MNRRARYYYLPKHGDLVRLEWWQRLSHIVQFRLTTLSSESCPPQTNQKSHWCPMNIVLTLTDSIVLMLGWFIMRGWWRKLAFKIFKQPMIWGLWSALTFINDHQQQLITQRAWAHAHQTCTASLVPIRVVINNNNEQHMFYCTVAAFPVPTLKCNKSKKEQSQKLQCFRWGNRWIINTDYKSSVDGITFSVSHGGSHFWGNNMIKLNNVYLDRRWLIIGELILTVMQLTVWI